MDRWERLWKRICKDVLLTGFGLYFIWRGIQPPHFEPYAILAGLTLTSPSIADHVRAILPSGSPPAPPTSGSSPSPGEPGSPPSSGARPGD
jgi:hypothetical protein